MSLNSVSKIEVRLGERSYAIHLGVGVLESLPELLIGLGFKGKVGVLTDSNVAPILGHRVQALLAGSGFEPTLCVMPAGEEYKRIERIEEFTGSFLQAGLDRTSCAIALGGGVVGDVAGYTAASYMRGIPFIQIPTTIVAQVDSSVGGKTGVTHPLGKNIIGAFHQPSAVLIDMSLLQTLPDRELRAGLAEVIKHGVIADEMLFACMEQDVGGVLAKDPVALELAIR